MNKIKFAFSSIIVILFLVFVYIITYTFVEPKAYDFMTKHVLTERLPFDTHKQTYGSDDVVVVVIDTKSAERYRWPWKRELLCKLAEIYGCNPNDLIKYWLADKVYSILNDEDTAGQVIAMVAEEMPKYSKSSSITV